MRSFIYSAVALLALGPPPAQQAQVEVKVPHRRADALFEFRGFKLEPGLVEIPIGSEVWQLQCEGAFMERIFEGKQNASLAVDCRLTFGKAGFGFFDILNALGYIGLIPSSVANLKLPPIAAAPRPRAPAPAGGPGWQHGPPGARLHRLLPELPPARAVLASTVHAAVR